MTHDDSPITSHQWVRLQELFIANANQPASEQRSFIEQLAATEPVIGGHLRALLDAAANSSSLDSDIDDAVHSVLLSDAGVVAHQHVGPYRVVKELGRGGMGIVYLAHRDDLDAPAAIKLLPNAWIDASRREQFLEEMRILAALSHPSIARLLHADHLPDGTPWFAMEFVAGVPITEWVRERRLPLADVLHLFDSLCAAVQHAHGHPVIHRDLKPSNVLVTNDGAVKLLDFGIAKRYLDRAGTDDRSRTVTRELSLPYAAPEQLRGEVAGVRADVYALGIILHELLAGRRPYEVQGDTAADAERAIHAAYPPRLAHALYRGGERRDLEALLAAALAPDVAARYGSVEALRGDVARLLGQEPLRARKMGWRYRARKFVRREWRALAGAVAVITAIAAGLYLHTRSLAIARDAAISEAAHNDHLRQFLEDLFEGGRQPAGPPDSVRVATLVENGIREARGLSSDPAMQADLLGTLGIVSERMGDFARADSLYLLTIARASALYGPNNPETLRVRVRRARLLAQLGQVDSAEAQLRALDSLASEHATSGLPVIAEVNSALGTVLRDRGRFPESIDRLERALALYGARDSTSREYASALRELGNAVGSAGDFARADSLWLRALPLVRRLSGPKHPDVAFLLADLGNTASQRGRLREAEQYQREAFAITGAWYGTDNYLTGAVGGVLAQTLIRERHYDEAVAILRRAVDAFSRAPAVGPASANTGICISILGNALSGRGDHREALLEYGKALAVLRATLGDKDRNTITVESNLASELRSIGRVDSSVAMLRHLATFAAAALGDSNVTVANVRVKLGASLLAARDYAEVIAVTTTGLHVLDSIVGPRAPQAIAARGTLLAAYEELGDSADASRMRRQLADSAGDR